MAVAGAAENIGMNLSQIPAGIAETQVFIWPLRLKHKVQLPQPEAILFYIGP